LQQKSELADQETAAKVDKIVAETGLTHAKREAQQVDTERSVIGIISGHEIPPAQPGTA